MTGYPSIDDDLHRYIEYLQTQLVAPGWEKIRDLEAYKTYVRSGPAIASRCSPEVWQKYQDLICQFQPSTKFDSPIARGVFEPILHDILEAAKQKDIAPIRPIHFATSADVAATALSVPSAHSHLLFAGIGTISFCNYWAKAFAQIVGYFGQDHGASAPMTSELLRATISRHPDVVALPIKLCAFHSYFKTLVGFGEVAIQPQCEAIRIQLVSAMELFVIGHEVGHFYLEEQLPDNSDEKVGHSTELVCDRYALQVSRTAASKRDNLIAFAGCGAYLFFRAAGFSFPSEDLAAADQATDSHPSMSTRVAELCREIRVTTPSDQLPLVDGHITEFGLICDEIERVLMEMPAVRWPEGNPLET